MNKLVSGLGKLLYFKLAGPSRSLGVVAGPNVGKYLNAPRLHSGPPER